MKKILPLCLLLLVSGCYKLNFSNGTPTAEEPKIGEWHLNLVFGLIEYQEPIDLHKQCMSAEWKEVKTERTFLQGLISGATYDLANPWNVSYVCK